MSRWSQLGAEIHVQEVVKHSPHPPQWTKPGALAVVVIIGMPSRQTDKFLDNGCYACCSLQSESPLLEQINLRRRLCLGTLQM
jgi:hypothetical protein